MTIRLTIDFSTSTIKARGWWNSIFKVLKQKTANAIFCHQWKSVKNEGKIKPFVDKQNQVSTSKISTKATSKGNSSRRRKITQKEGSRRNDEQRKL